MNLQFIKQATCPKCGASPSMESVKTCDGVISRHCNGETWETRKFACGYMIEWIPNYKSAQEYDLCEKSQAYKEKLRKRKDALEAMNTFIDNIDVDDDMKRRFRGGVW